MRLALASLLVASLAFADPPKDAPLADPDAKGRTLDVDAGTIVPFDAQCLDGQEQVRRARREARLEATLAKAEQDVLLPKAAVVGLIIGSLALGAVVSAGVVLAAKK